MNMGTPLPIVDTRTGEIIARMPPEIAAAIVEVKGKVRQLGQDENNPHGGYRYVSVDKFYERVGPIMAAAGLALLIDEDEVEVKANEKTGSPWLFAKFSLTFVHKSGSMAAPLHRSIALPISGPQAYGAAQSYIEKQFLRQVFKIPTGEKDADATETTGEPPAKGRPAATTKPAPEKTAAQNGASGTKDEQQTPDQKKAREAWYSIRAAYHVTPTEAEIDKLNIDRGNDLKLIETISKEARESLRKHEENRREMLRKLVPAGKDEMPI